MRRWVSAIAWATFGVGCGAAQREAPPDPAPQPITPVVAHAEAPVEPAAEPAAPQRKRFVPATRPLIADGYLERFADRARLRSHRPADETVAVVSREPGRERVVLDAPTFRMLAWLEPSDLHDVTLGIVRVSPAPNQVPAPGGTGATLAPGTRLERRRQQGQWVSIVTETDLRVSGWLHASQLGHVYRPADLPKGAAPATMWELVPGSKLLSSPGGKALAELPKDFIGQLVVGELRSVGWYVEVVWTSAEAEVRGFVPKQRLRQFEPQGFGFGYGSGLAMKHPTERLVYDAGTCLYEQPRGEVIGVVRRKLDVTVHVETGDNAAWRELRLGSVPLAFARRSDATPYQGEMPPSGPPIAVPIDGWDCPD